MGHILEILVVALIGLAIFGPKVLQSLAREAGKTAGHAKNLKDAFSKEVSDVTDQIPRVPLNSRQALEMLTSSDKKEERSSSGTQESASKPAPETVGKPVAAEE
ncbi:MAG: twin-arginine translocase TatA/TatE family subunit [Ktedonobacteraceae bacterium]|nr:twin-arginine translocase TatA/TatE family subunit [Ktedonobacteraceae bacterium]